MNYEHDGWNHNVSTCQPYIKACLSLTKKRQISAHVCQQKRLLRTFTSDNSKPDSTSWFLYKGIHFLMPVYMHISTLVLMAQLKKSACHAADTGDKGLTPGVRKISRSRRWQPTPVFLPGKTPWAEEPGGLQFMGSQRIGHD